MRTLIRYPQMRTLEATVRANLKCHFAGLAIQFPESHATSTSILNTDVSPKASKYDPRAAVEGSYRISAELTRVNHGPDTARTPAAPASPAASSQVSDAASTARQKVVKALRESPEFSEVGDLFHEDPYKGIVIPGTFAPIFFIYNLPNKVQAPEGEMRAAVGKFNFVYNGKLLIVAGFCEPDKEMSGLSEAVTKVSEAMARSGYEFHPLSPSPTLQSVDIGVVSMSSTPTSAALNDTASGGGRPSVLTSAPRSVPGVLQSLYAKSFQYLMPFYSMKEQSDEAEALMQTIEAHRGTVLELMREYNQSRWYNVLRKMRLRRLLRGHCLSLTEKIGRVDALSSSITRGVNLLESELQLDPRLRVALERGPGWKGFLPHDFDTKPIMDMVTRTSDEISRRDMTLTVAWVAVLSAAVGGVVAYLVARML